MPYLIKQENFKLRAIPDSTKQQGGAKMKIEHFILMMNRETDEEIEYKGVIGYELLENGNLLQLNFSDGSTATFSNHDWLMFDLTPMRGWNHGITQTL